MLLWIFRFNVNLKQQLQQVITHKVHEWKITRTALRMCTMYDEKNRSFLLCDYPTSCVPVKGTQVEKERKLRLKRN